MAKADEPAFPDPHYEGSTVTGLTKREYFAALAMQGILSKQGFSTSSESLSIFAVRYADSILEKLEK